MRRNDPIASVENPRYRHWLRIARRGALPDGRKVLAVEGPKLVAEALAAGWHPVLIAATNELNIAAVFPRMGAAQAERLVLAPHLFEKLAEATTPQQPFVLVVPPGAETDDPATPAHQLACATRLLVADAIQDPGNVGALMRSAGAFGFAHFISTPTCAVSASAKVLRASAGALFRMRLLPPRPAQTLAADLLRLGFLVVVLDANAHVPMEQVPWRDPVALVIGNEAHGPSCDWEFDPAPELPGRILRACIPMTPTSESLNAAVAGSIALYQASRRLGPPPSPSREQS